MTRTPARLLLPVALVAGLTACGGGDSSQVSPGTTTATGPASAQTATVLGTRELKYSPGTVKAVPGTLRLTLAIDGGVPHDLQFEDSAVGPAIAQTSDKATGTYTFSKAGTYSFVCTLHPGMAGQVVVG